ncbi:helix-turn-helix domain-containing protein [Phocaeicola faecium]|uniref:Helix-turn-helix transcriptional regulator n=1 Tax=Phocaeicola faecium TaxID=2762213 RepID=A0ABR8V8G0_9BACT|nr:helix-turn-helix transcriptional regulator [Phocaeicola faecium]MBD8000956.1 helix-turn-helix transcriptional regulator [Phocaeicola faecium]
MLFGNRIRELRDKQGVLQRQLAALLEIDTPMFSKIERGDRRAKREHVIKLAEYLHQDVKEMLTLWLADKVLDAVGVEEEISYDAITVAQKHVQSSIKDYSTF